MITLGTQGVSKTFSASGDRYLRKTLAAKGELVSNYYGVTQGELANEIAMMSGQGPTPQTEAGCAHYDPITPGTLTKSDSQVTGRGCVYPEETETLASELTAKHDSWRAYVEGLGDLVKLPASPSRAPTTSTTSSTTSSTGTTTTTSPTTSNATTTTTPTTSTGATTAPAQESSAATTTATTAAAQAARAAHPAIVRVGSVNAATCRHPAVGTADPFQTTSKTDRYVTWRDPFVYFRSVTTVHACVKDVVGLPSLAGDLKSASTTPTVSFVYPDPCDDGSSDPCYSGAPSGLRPANRFLSTIVPEIINSAAYKQGGLILITFAQAPQTGRAADSNSCCDNPTTYPNIPLRDASGNVITTGTTTATQTTTTSGSNAAGTTTAAYAVPGATTSCLPSGTSTTPTTTSTTTTPTTTSTTSTTSSTGTTSATTTSGAGSTTTPSATTPCTAPAGGQVGLLAISQYVKAGSSDLTDSFNHFSLLGSIEQLFGLKRLGYAADKQLPLFGAGFYTNYTPS